MTETGEQPADADLIMAVREGDVSAFGVLYERHLVAAKRAAACLVQAPAEREDLVAEAFTRVLRMLREGRGPQEEFRPYLLVTLRNAAIHSGRRGALVSLCADVPDVSPTEAVDDPVIDRWHAGVAADAFASLPERWRVVLWHTEVENESPSTVAPILGMRPNSVAALAYRAREGLRQAYLRMHVSEPSRRGCRSTVDKLAGYVRQCVPPPLSRKINKHLALCSDCRARADALTKVNAELRGLLGLIVLGGPLAAAYLPAPAVSGAVTGALSGVASGVGSGVASGAVSGGLSGSASGTVSGLLAVKAAAVQAATALAVAATAVTVTSSAPPAPAGPAPAVARGLVAAPAHHGATLAMSGGAPGPRTPPAHPIPAAPTGVSHAPAGASHALAGRSEPVATSHPATPGLSEAANRPEKERPKAAKKDRAHGASGSHAQPAHADGGPGAPKHAAKAREAKDDKSKKGGAKQPGSVTAPRPVR